MMEQIPNTGFTHSLILTPAAASKVIGKYPYYTILAKYGLWEVQNIGFFDPDFGKVSTPFGVATDLRHLAILADVDVLHDQTVIAAAIIHEWLYERAGEGCCESLSRPFTRGEADLVLYRAIMWAQHAVGIPAAIGNPKAKEIYDKVSRNGESRWGMTLADKIKEKKEKGLNLW